MPRPGDEEYETAYRLGKLLGENGFGVCTGGYQGIMDAVSKGAAENGQEAIGITVQTFHANVSANLTKEIRCDTLFERIEKLIENGDGFIILRGGTGTLVELSILWEMINKKMLENKPISCHGKMWESLLDTMNERMKYEGRQFGLIFHSEKIEECAWEVIIKLQ